MGSRKSLGIHILCFTWALAIFSCKHYSIMAISKAY
ncbi:hypothetical protein X975_20402, partial [Stegodyphus mimosarum]